MRSFFIATLLLALTCVPSYAQFNFPALQSARYPSQTSSFGAANPNSIDAGYAGSRYPVTQSLSTGSPDSGSGYTGFGASGSYPQSTGTGNSPTLSENGNPNTRIFGLLGGGRGGGGGGGLFSNLLGALTGRNRNPVEGGGGFGGGGFGGGAYPVPVPAQYPGYSPYGIPSPYAGGFGYPGFGGGYYG